MFSRNVYEPISTGVDDPDSDEEAANDIAEVLDGDFSADYAPRVATNEKEEKKRGGGGIKEQVERETNEVKKLPKRETRRK